MTIGNQSFLLNGLDNSLGADVAAIDTTITVADTAVLPTDVPFYLVVNPFDDNGREYMLCTNVAGAVLTVTRELEGSEGNEHTTGNIVRFAWNKQHLDDLWNAIDSLAKNLSISPYTFRIATDGTPDAGEWERDNVTVASVTELFFHEDDLLDEQHDLFFTGLQDGDLLIISSSVDDGQEQYTVTGPGVLATNVYTVPVKDGAVSGTAFIDTLSTTVGAVFGRFLKLDQLVDVDVASVSDLDVLSFIQATGNWEARANNANKGIVTLEYLFDANQSTNPASGDAAPNNAVFASVTVLAVNETDANGDNVGFSLSSISENDVIRLVDKANDANFQEYTVVSNTDQGLFVDYAVTPGTDGGTIADNAPIWLYHLAVLPNLDETYLRLDTANNPLTGTLGLGTNFITDVLDPVNPQDAATKASSEGYTDQEVAAGIALKMDWQNEWAPGTYQLNDVVRDGDWTMVANKLTSDRAAPQPAGAVAAVYAGLSPTTQDTVQQVLFGQRYSFSGFGTIEGFRIFTIAGQEYTVYTILDPDGTPILDLVIEFVATTTGWQNVDTSAIFVGAGVVLELIAVTITPDPIPTVFTGNWDYNTPAVDNDPVIGEISQADGTANIMRINKTDDDLGDRSAELATLVTGDVIQYDEPNGTRYLIIGITDQGTFIDFNVSPAVQSTPDGVFSFAFESNVAAPVFYMEDIDYWTTNPPPFTIQGILSLDGAAATYSDEAFGTDLFLQPYTASADWDLLSIIGGSSAGGGESGPAPNGLPVGGTAGQRLNKIDATDFNTEWKDMLHADITDVGVDDHHTRYTDAEAVTALDDADVYVKLAGDTMTGVLILDGTVPSGANDATNKDYVDTRDALLLPLAGGTLTGFLTLHADPTLALHAATMQYVDAQVLVVTSPTTTLGDVIKRGAAVDERLAIGTAAQVLTVNVGGTEPEWQTPATGVTDHANLTNVTTSQHHVRYDDTEAVTANTGIWLSLGGGAMSGDQAIATIGVKNIVASATEPVSPDIGLVWIDIS